MCNHNSRATVAKCRFVENLAVRGGAMWNDVQFAGLTGILSDFSPRLTRCVFLRNRALRSGGAIHNDITASVLTSCSFIGNFAGTDGGAIFARPGGTLVNCLFSGNFAEDAGDRKSVV